MKITIFSEELRKCLNAAGLSDCGENDTWNYWYQRLMNVYNESVERQIMTEQTENAKLRELVEDMLPFIAEETGYCVTADCFVYPACCDNNGDEECPAVTRIHERARELGIEVDE